MRRPGREPLARPAVCLALYALLGVASFLPQSLHPADTVAYVGDSLESVYIVAWNVHQFFSSPARLFDANLLHPHPRALAFTDHRLLPSLAVAPLIWATHNPVFAYNVAVMLACLLAAMAGRRLAALLGADPWAAWAAGALYAFHTYQVNEAPRLNIVFHGFIPLALGELVCYLKTGERRRAWSTAALMLLQGLSANYHLLYGCLLLGTVLLGALLARPRAILGRLPALAAAGTAAALAFLPIALPYVQLAKAHGFTRVLPRGIDLVHYFSTTPTNLVWGAIGAEVRLQQQGPHFIGFVSLALAILACACWAVRRGADAPASLVPARLWVPVAAALSLLLVTLSLGSDVVAFGTHLGPGPYRFLHRWVPGFQLVRIPERLSLLAMLFVALLVARGLTLLRPRLGSWTLALALAVPLEHLSPLPHSERIPIGRRIPQVYRWLAEHPVQGYAEVPTRGESLVRRETLEMYFSTVGFKPVIHGYTAYPPLLSRLLRRLAAEFPSEAALQAFARVGVDTVVVHHGRPLGVDLDHQLKGQGEVDPARLESLVRVAGLDLYDRLPEAVGAGRLRLLARFAGPAAGLFESTADEIYRIVPPDRHPAAPFPSGRRRLDPAWRYRTKSGDPGPACDGDLATAWQVPRKLNGDEFFEVVFPRPLRVSGLALRLRRDSVFPTRYRIGAQDLRGSWAEVARFDEAHALQLVDALLRDPGQAALGFELAGREVTGLNLLVEEGGTSPEGWNIPEIEVLVP